MRSALIWALPAGMEAAARTAAGVTNNGGTLMLGKRRYHARQVVGGEEGRSVTKFELAQGGWWSLYIIQPEDEGPAAGVFHSTSHDKRHLGPWTPDVFRREQSAEVWEAVLSSWWVIWGGDTMEAQVLQTDAELKLAIKAWRP